jgi:hypothetical protein
MTFPKDCRGTLAKQEILKNYRVRVLTRWKVLNRAEPLAGCCGPLVDEAYMFEYQNKVHPEDEGTFYVGYDCAEQFLELLGQLKPPLRNLLAGPSRDSPTAKGGPKGQENQGRGPLARHPLNDEMELAVIIIVNAWGSDPRAPLRRILSAVQSRPLDPASDSLVKTLVKVIAADQQKRTLTQMAEDLATFNPSLYRPTFPEILKVVARLQLPNRIA